MYYSRYNRSIDIIHRSNIIDTVSVFIHSASINNSTCCSSFECYVGSLSTVHDDCDFVGKTVDYSATSVAFQEAKELVKAFETRSSHVPHALSTLDSIFNKLQPQVRSRFKIIYRSDVFRTTGYFPNTQMCLYEQSHSPSSDVVMNDDTVEDSQPTTTGVSHQEVWALFEKIWSSMIEAR